MQSMRVDEKVCLITYLNEFDAKIAYQLRDKDLRTLREAFQMAINVENNLRITGRLESKRDDPRLFSNKGNKREDHKILGGKRRESNEMGQVLNAIKSLSLPQVKNDRNTTNNRIPYQSNLIDEIGCRISPTLLLGRMVILVFPFPKIIVIR